MPSGIKCLHIPRKSMVSHFGVLINTGTRDEKNDEGGCAHLVEHSLFKGTTLHSGNFISKSLDKLGADVNAYTTKEETCFHASFMSEFYPKIMSIFADMLFNSKFPTKEINNEINVIREEILSCEDSSSEKIFDDFEGLLYKHHDLGKNILGTVKQIDKYVDNPVVPQTFYKNNYLNEEIVLWTDGDISEKKFKTLCGKYFGDSPFKSGKHERNHPKEYNKFYVTIQRDDIQSNVIMGGGAFSYFDDDKIPFTLLNHVLGNDGMSSYLNKNIREKRGLVYVVESNYTAYADMGTFNIFFESEKRNTQKVIDLIEKILDKCKQEKISDGELKTAKQQLKGTIAVASDIRLNDVISAAKSLVTFDKVEDLPTIFQKIEKITADDMLKVANVVFDDANMSTLIYNPR